jgi:alpha-amylase
MRLDAAKHFSAKFQKDFVNHIRSTSNPDFFVIGEYWTGDVQAIMDYLETLENKIVAYDVPLVEKFSELSHTRDADLRGIFKDTLVQRRPDQAVVRNPPSPMSSILDIERLTFEDHCVKS